MYLKPSAWYWGFKMPVEMVFWKLQNLPPLKPLGQSIVALTKTSFSKEKTNVGDGPNTVSESTVRNGFKHRAQ